MQLAMTKNAIALFHLLHEIDATRAPLHPLLLQLWVKLFGASDSSGRIFSVLSGIGVVGLVYRIGLRVFDRTTGIYACWLCAISPFLVYYSREARMYMWLVLVTCMAWYFLFSLSFTSRPWKLVPYGLSLLAIAYSHPLGLLMVMVLGFASLIFRQAFQISWPGWLCTHLIVLVALAPWVPRYFNHAPESITGSLPFRYLLGMPIGFIGGNSAILLVCFLLIVFGLFERYTLKTGVVRIRFRYPVPSICLLLWFVLPSVTLYAYSHVGYPLFGPPRYTLFVGPAYLLLIALALSKLPTPIGITALAIGTTLSGAMLLKDVYPPDLKADWKDVATFLNQRDPRVPVVVIASSPFDNTQLVTARYYFGPTRAVSPWSDQIASSASEQELFWVSISLDNGRLADALPSMLTADNVIREVVNFSRLRLMLVDFHQAHTSER
jgi:4-amino-4-deoxy-L-arabinose transferase-like glycosyltransferase